MVSTCSIARGDKLLAVLSGEESTPVVFEASKPDFERYDSATENLMLVPTPVTEQTLLDAVARAVCTGPAQLADYCGNQG